MTDFFRGIGGFQFQNLIHNRVPFLLINLEVDTQGLFPPFHQAHLDRQSLKATSIEALFKVREMAVPADHAIVLLSKDGEGCKSLAENLENAGYSNVYWIHGGLLALRQELS